MNNLPYASLDRPFVGGKTPNLHIFSYIAEPVAWESNQIDDIQSEVLLVNT